MTRPATTRPCRKCGTEKVMTDHRLRCPACVMRRQAEAEARKRRTPAGVLLGDICWRFALGLPPEPSAAQIYEGYRERARVAEGLELERLTAAYLEGKAWLDAREIGFEEEAA